MKTDLYTKIVLTLIALGLWAILLKPVFISENVTASTGIIDVNIKQVDGKRASSVLDVNIEKVNGRTYFGTSIPVSIGK